MLLLIYFVGWDLEYNKVIRHYHGHLSGVFCLAIHPSIDVLVSGGRDSVARVSILVVACFFPMMAFVRFGT